MTATATDIPGLSDLIALAFHPLAPSAWLIEAEQERRETLPGYFRILVEHAMATGSVYTNADRTSAALWLPVGLLAQTFPADYDARLAATTGARVQRFRAFDTALDETHPTGLAHHHLAILAVHPEHQGHGIGSALLSAQHGVLDARRRPAYLEASDLRTRKLYLSHGYRDCALPIRLPGDPETLMYPMWREPDVVAASKQHVPGSRVVG